MYQALCCSEGVCSQGAAVHSWSWAGSRLGSAGNSDCGSYPCLPCDMGRHMPNDSVPHLEVAVVILGCAEKTK